MVFTWSNLISTVMATVRGVAVANSIAEDNVVRGGEQLVPPSVNVAIYPAPTNTRGTNTRNSERPGRVGLTASVDVYVTLAGSSRVEEDVDRAVSVCSQLGRALEDVMVVVEDIVIVNQVNESGQSVNQDHVVMVVQCSALWRP